MNQSEDIDLLESEHVRRHDTCALVFCSVETDLDVPHGSRDGAASAEFLGKVPATIRSERGWRRLALPDASSDVSSSKMPTTRAASPNTSDLFNSLPID
jgi:hypothetical protein